MAVGRFSLVFFVTSWVMGPSCLPYGTTAGGLALEGLAERAVSSTYLGALPASRAANAASTGRAGGSCFFF